jgi:uncharacterized protein YbjT (DUF2867 family)
MRVFVAGGTGAVGRYLIPSLVADGHQVTASTRSAGKSADLASLSSRIRSPPTHERDVAAVAVRVLTDDRYSGAKHVLTGPQVLGRRLPVGLAEARGHAVR